MSGAETLSVELVRKALEVTLQSGRSRTVYSNIYDLKNAITLTHNRGNFEEAVAMNLARELEKGGRRLDLGSLFRATAEREGDERVSRADEPEPHGLEATVGPPPLF